MNNQRHQPDQNLKSALIVVENTPYHLDTRVRQEATSLRDAGWTVNVLCPFKPDSAGMNALTGKAQERHDRDGVTVNYFPLFFAEKGVVEYVFEYLSAFYWIALRSWKIYRKERFQVIQFCNPPDIFFPIAYFYRWMGVRVIFDHHDLFPELISTRFKGAVEWTLYKAARIMEYLTLHAAHIVITTNRSFQKIAETRGRYPSERIFVVRNGPLREQFVPLDPDPALKKGFKNMAVFAGIMGHQDGVTELIESIRYLIETRKRRDILFVLLGDGAARAAALETIEKWADGCIQMPGLIRDNRLLRTYLSTADVLVSPEPYNTLNDKSTFIKMGEYVAMGKAIVAYDLTETRNTAQDAALYVPHGDTVAYAEAILQLVDRPDLRAQLENAARKRVEELVWENQLPNLLTAYQAALKS